MAGNHPRWRLHLAHHGLGKDAHLVQDRPAGLEDGRRQEGALCGGPQGPGLPNHEGVRQLRAQLRQLQLLGQDIAAATEGRQCDHHHHHHPEAVEPDETRHLRQRSGAARDPNQGEHRPHLRRMPSLPVRRHAQVDCETGEEVSDVWFYWHTHLCREYQRRKQIHHNGATVWRRA